MPRFCSLAIVLGILSLTATAPAADEPAWQGLLGDFPKAEKAGPFGLHGICVDHASGDVFINISDRGFYRSTDGGKSFKRLSDTQPKGRTEEPGCFLIDPTGKSKKMVTALVYGSPIGVSSDGGVTWKMMDGKSGHVDWCAVDWTDPDMKFVLAVKHEVGGLLLASTDGGTSFAEVGRGYGTGWVFDGQTAVVAKGRPKPNLVRTADGGKTWKPCGEYNPVGGPINSTQALPKWHDGTLYWLVDGALIATTDKGETWKKVCDLKDGRYGPVFGKDAKHMFVLTQAGIVETTDGGASWGKPLAAPAPLKQGSLTWLEYDPKSDSLYIMRPNSDLYKLARGK